MASSKIYGAAPEEWDHFDLVLGLGPDLLPVVSNHTAELSPDSKVKDIGKTPSRYNKDRKVVGIAGWTAHQASDQDIARWSKEADYGICVQTRSVRALDIDVPDAAKARAIAEAVALVAGEMPMRMRVNTGKCLLAFIVEGDLGKRKMEVDGGIVEFLATGQQFVAVGTHPSGVPYSWVGGLPAEFPVLTLDQFEALWSALATQFAVGEVVAGQVSARKRGEHVDMPDPVADHLRAQGLVVGEDRDGALVVACPWEAQHTTGSRGDGSTVWFPAGTNGYPKGHFKCLHGHCEGRSDDEFCAAVGYVEDVGSDFEVVAPAPGEAQPVELPRFKRDKQGAIEATVENATLAVRRGDFTGVDIKFDRFRDEIMFAAHGSGQWQTFGDPDYTRLRIQLERRGFKPVGRELIRDVVALVASESPFDSAQEWLGRLQWDGVPRVETFLHTYFSAEDSPYTRAVSCYLWTALAGRVLVPGCQADMTPVLIGKQGKGKTSAVKAIVPSAEHFVEVRLDKRDEDTARELRGKLVGEIGELRGLMSRDSEDIKAWISRTHEEWVPKYKEFSVQFPRRLIFIGTTNKSEFLVDDTGNRRWLPAKVGDVDIEAIRRDRLQLWAEARERFELLGVEWQAAQTLAEEVHEEHMVSDSWADVVGAWLDTPDDLTGEVPRARKFLRVGDVLKNALSFDQKHVGRREESRVGAILRTLGYARKKVRDGSRLVWAYVPLCSPS
jgi:Virulence-associated protein E/Bifunctional DNA primase/polymerase, N-terminal